MKRLHGTLKVLLAPFKDAGPPIDVLAAHLRVRRVKVAFRIGIGIADRRLQLLSRQEELMPALRKVLGNLGRPRSDRTAVHPPARA